MLQSFTKYRSCYSLCQKCPNTFTCDATLPGNKTGSCLWTCSICGFGNMQCTGSSMTANITRVSAYEKIQGKCISLLITHFPHVIFEEISCSRNYSSVLVCQKYDTKYNTKLRVFDNAQMVHVY